MPPIVYFATTLKSPCKKDVGTLCCHITVKYNDFSVKKEDLNSAAHFQRTRIEGRIRSRG